MSQERKTRQSARLKNQKQKPQPQPVVSSIPPKPKRAHLAQKSLFDSDGKRIELGIVLSQPLEDILYCGAEPDFETAYFSLDDALKNDCYNAEKTGLIDSPAIKTKAAAVLRAIQHTIQLTNNENIIHLFNHLAELINDHLISPDQLNLTHLKVFLSKRTNNQESILDDNVVLPLISVQPLPPLEEMEKFVVPNEDPLFEELGEFAVFPQKDLPSPSHPELKESEPDNDEQDNMDPILEGFDKIEYSFDAEIPIEDYRIEPVAPQFIGDNSSWAKIMATMQEAKTETIATTLKRPESPNSEETLAVTPPPSKKIALDDDHRIAKQLSLGLRERKRINYKEEHETPMVCHKK